jgi:hypothetical protein
MVHWCYRVCWVVLVRGGIGVYVVVLEKRDPVVYSSSTFEREALVLSKHAQDISYPRVANTTKQYRHQRLTSELWLIVFR